MSRRSKSSIIFEPVNSTDPCKTVVQSNLNVKKDATLKCDLDVKKCLNVKNVVYCEENIDDLYQNISSDISLSWVNINNGEGCLEEGKKDGMYKKIVKTVTGTTNGVWSRIGNYPNNGFSNIIITTALDPNNEKNIYVGGFFLSPYSGIAKWDGCGWTSVGIPGDFTDGIRKITFNPITGEGPYVGGNFTQVGGDPNLNYLVKWDSSSSSWTSVKSGGDQIVGNYIFDILFTPGGSGPYVCGRFSEIGGATSNSIGYFDGTNWITNVFRPEPITFTNYKMTIDNAGTQLLVTSGNFLALLVFNFPLNFGGYASTSARIYSISTSPNDIVYIGVLGAPGEYIGGITGLYLAKYDNSSLSWTSVSGQTGEFNNLITNISFDQTSENPYVGGRFTQVDGNPNLNFLTKWGGTSVGWTSIDPNGDNILFDPITTGDQVSDIKFSSDYKNIYVSGLFEKSINRPINIAKYGPSNEYNISYNKGSGSELLINEGDSVSFIYNEDLEEWIKLN